MSSAPFELAGRFGGFVFTDAGKRRLLLRCGDDTRLLKVPRMLRRRIIGKFGVGELIRVAGTEELDPESGARKQVVSQVLPGPGQLPAGLPVPAPAAPVAIGVIRVCAKKNCWRKGGRELWHALGQQLDAQGLAGSIELRQVGCLDRCQQAPNVDGGRRAHSLCSPREAAAIIAQAAGQPSRGELEGSSSPA